MTIKRAIYRMLVRTLERLTQLEPPKEFINCADFPSCDITCLLVTIAFNNSELISLQHQFVEKFLTASTNNSSGLIQVIVDNSTKTDVRHTIQDLCKNSKRMIYLGMPKNWLNIFGPSYSHAMAVNYAYHHLIKKMRPTYWGLIDHDVFPIVPINIQQKMNNRLIYGPLMNQDPEHWYLHPSLSIFNSQLTQKYGVDFIPAKPANIFLDAGGGNWEKIYSHLQKEKQSFVDVQLETLRGNGDWHSDTLEFYDKRNWLHTINGSCWKPIKDADGKAQLIKEYLLNILHQQCEKIG